MPYMPSLFYAKPYWYLVVVELKGGSAFADAYVYLEGEFYAISSDKPERGATRTGVLAAMVARCKAGEFRDKIRRDIVGD